MNKELICYHIVLKNKYKIGWMVKKEKKEKNIVDSIPYINKKLTINIWCKS